MEEKNQDHTHGNNKDNNHPRRSDHSDIADVVSLETVVGIMLDKRICTAEELYEAEKNRRLHLDKASGISLVRTDDSGSSRDGESPRRKQNWLKRKMSKRRFTRRLGTALFGWEWKKVKLKEGAEHLENLKK
ncbi:MAG: hypothetical protein ACE5G1_07600 [bacterium]